MAEAAYRIDGELVDVVADGAELHCTHFVVIAIVVVAVAVEIVHVVVAIGIGTENLECVGVLISGTIGDCLGEIAVLILFK